MPPQADHHTLRARARVGTVLDEKWTLDALIGVGGMASVFAATHRNGKHAAIKLLHAEAALNPSVRARFLREGYVANRVGHPGAVSILDDDAAPDGTVYLVMELLEGETLDARWERCDKRLPDLEVLTILDQLLDVLAAAHAKQIVHRDLKPGNLFLTREGTVKVLDFGIARLGEINADNAGATTSFHSSMGTLGFMPPEQARGRWEQVGPQTDLWAIGATMYALLTGRHVHEAVTANERLLLAMTKPAPPIRTVKEDVSEAVAAIADRALQFEPAKRWDDAKAMQAAVRDAYTSLTGKNLSLAPRLIVVEGVGSQRASQLEEHAPTMLATSGSIGASRRPRRSSGVAIAIGAVVVAGVTAFAMARGASKPSSDAAAVATPASRDLPVEVAPEAKPPETTAPPMVASAAPAPAPSSAVFPVHVSPSVSPAVSPSRVHPAARAEASASASAAPSANPPPAVDLFERRR
jgi:serine/threonine protein kinase